MRHLTALICLWMLLSAAATPVIAAIDAYEFVDPSQQKRYEQLVDELRCPQCLNTNLSGSDSMIAKDLRREIHRLVTDGKSDDEVREFMFQRYGDFILYRPRVNVSTLFLWFGPGIIFLAAMLFLARFLKHKKNRQVEDLSSSDQVRLMSLLREEGSEQ